MNNSTVFAIEPKGISYPVGLWFTSITQIVEGAMMMVGNLLLMAVILSQKRLRRKEFLTLAGLAFADFLYGIAIFAAGTRRVHLLFLERIFSLVTPWSCMKEYHSLFFILGYQAGTFMLVVVTMDRLIAVKWFSTYQSLGKRYAYTVMSGVYGYTFLTVPVVVVLSAFFSNPDPSVIAMCLSTQLGPAWFAYYQPNVQMWGGIVSILLFVLTWYFYNQHTTTHLSGRNMAHVKKQRKLTRTVGITVLVTFFTFVLPHGTILIMRYTAPTLASLLNPYAWVISNLNNLSNIFILGIYNGEVRPVLKSWGHGRRYVDNKSPTTTRHNPKSGRRTGISANTPANGRLSIQNPRDKSTAHDEHLGVQRF